MLPWQNLIWRSMNIMNVQFGCSQESFLSIIVIYRSAYSFKTCKEMPCKHWSLQRNHSSNLMYLMRLKSGIHEQLLKDFVVYMENIHSDWNLLSFVAENPWFDDRRSRFLQILAYGSNTFFNVVTHQPTGVLVLASEFQKRLNPRAESWTLYSVIGK